jgi:trimeric autotransporter adhesin
MKMKLYTVSLIAVFTSFCIRSNAQADQYLSNLLSPTAVNQHLLPYKTSSYRIGGPELNWQSIYLQGAVYFRDSVALYAPGIANFFGGLQTGSPFLTGHSNAGFGYYTLSSLTSGYHNAAIGNRALYSNTTGYGNIAMGHQALTFNLGGDVNVAIGRNALMDNTSGGGNTAVGNAALTNSNGSNNTAIGFDAMMDNSSGGWNSAIGSYALDNNTTGSDNAALGEFGLHANTTGHHNTAVGANADVSSGGLHHATAIGADATVNASNKIQLGSSTTVLATTGGVTIVSDGRFKNNVGEEDVPGLAFINQLRPVAYNVDYKKYDDFLRKNQPGDARKRLQDNTDYERALAQKGQQREVGFIAQDIDQLCKTKKYSFNGVYTPQNENDNYALDYSRFVVPLTKAVQELSAMNAEKDAKIEHLQQQINELKAAIMKGNDLKTFVSDASLDQNVPNPFNRGTSITYNIPPGFSSAHIFFSDKAGRLLKQMAISSAGKGTLTLDASVLSAGAYSYSLVIDGRIMQTRQMMVVK